MSNCKQCDKPIEEHTGRNKRKYCSKKCRTTYLNSRKPKERAMVKLKTHEKVLQENAALKDLVAELRKNNPVLDRGGENIMGLPPLSLANEVAIYNATHEDSKVTIFTQTTQDEINRLKGELALISGKSDFANNARRNIQRRIDKLEKTN